MVAYEIRVLAERVLFFFFDLLSAGCLLIYIFDFSVSGGTSSNKYHYRICRLIKNWLQMENHRKS